MTTQVSLPGQTHVAEGPHDQTGMYLMHHAFRRDLAAFEAAVRRTPVEDAPTWRALRARWARFSEVLHHHHRIEDDAIWPVLARHSEASGAAADLATLADMEAEHEGIDPSLAACTAGFAAMVSQPGADHRNALDVHLTATRAALLEHLRHEETQALPLLQRVMTEAEFAASEKAAGEGYPVRMVPFLVPWVMEGVPDEVAGAFLRRAGAAYVVALRVFRPAWRRGERRAFRHV